MMNTSNEGERQVTRRPATGQRGMVTARHPLVAAAGVQVLKDGGNAVDAAVAMAFATGVAEPLMSGLGGGGFMTVFQAGGESAVIDYQVRAPLAAHATMYELTPAFRMDGQGFVGVKDDANYRGHRSAAVPGLVAGLETARSRFGTLPLAQLVEPAVALAEDGYPVTWYTTLTLATYLSVLRRYPATAATFLQDGLPYAASQEGPVLFRQPELAGTLRRIAAEGPEGFYRGPVAHAIAAEMSQGGGIITEEDLARYQAKILTPLRSRYRGLELVGLPAPASGALLMETLNVLDGWDLGGMGGLTENAMHHTIAAMRASHADRLAYLGDPEFIDVPQAGLIDAGYAATRRAAIDRERHTPIAPGDPWAFQSTRPARAPLPAGVEAGDGGCTTHLSAVDRWGNCAAVTQTITSGWGSAVTVPGTGVLLNDAMTLFDPRPGMANSIEPWKRPASSMCHTIVLREGAVVLVAGAPGGRRILDTVTQVLLNVIDHGRDVQTAVGGPFADTSSEDVTLIDDRVAHAVRTGLEERGHTLRAVRADFSPSFFARPAAISRDPASGALTGGLDPYAEGAATGY